MNSAKMTMWFIAGLGVGTGLTFLYGTRAGRRARRQLTRSVEDSRERLTEVGQEFMEKGKQLIDRGRGFVESTGGRWSGYARQ